MNDAPQTFMVDVDVDEHERDNHQVIWTHLPIGAHGETLAITTHNSDEIDLSEHEIGDTGMAVLCANLSTTAVRTLDLDSNALTYRGEMTLATALGLDAAPHLVHLDLMCNSIGSEGAQALARAMSMSRLPELQYLDLSGNGIGDAGAVAIARALANVRIKLQHLNLGTNGIDDAGCAALSSLLF